MGFDKDILGIILPFAFTSLLLYGIRETRFKWNEIDISGHTLIVKRFFGFGKSIQYDLDKVRLMTISVRHVATEPVRTINLYDLYHQRVIEISSSVYTNFAEIETFLSSKVKAKGLERYKIKDVIKSSVGIPIRYDDSQGNFDVY